MKTIEDRYAKQKVRPESIAAAESASDEDGSDKTEYRQGLFSLFLFIFYKGIIFIYLFFLLY
jgi:hypothetical protein